ncbi:MAG: sugar phosphate isomerase/epimerase [Acidobacteriota bacterium]|nr:sugar phosphate isomerase/epimerase [Acidobacteriota bacterium]
MELSRRTVLSTLAASTLQAQSASRKTWKPKLGILGNYSEENIAFAKQEGFTSIGLWARGRTSLDPAIVTDDLLAKVKASVARSGLYLSVVGSTVNHVDPDLTKRRQINESFRKVIEIAGKLGAPYVGTGSGAMPGRSLDENVAELVKVYSEQYFPTCQKYSVRILWEPYPGSPNVATGPIGYDALFKAFGNSPYVGLQYDPSHLVWQMMDPIQTARDYVDKIYDVHLKDTEVFTRVLRRCGINPPDKTKWWRYRIPGLGQMDWPAFFTVLQDAGYSGAMNIEHEDPVYGDPQRGDVFNEGYKEGFRMGYRYLRQYVPV